MAERRMIKRQIVMSDIFLAMNNAIQLLYYQLMLEADDDGFISNPLTLVRMVDSRKEYLEVLEEKGYLIRFASGVVLVKHWFQHNYIRPDRHHESVLPEKRLVTLTKEKIYILNSECNLPAAPCPAVGRTEDGPLPRRPAVSSLSEGWTLADREREEESFARPHCSWVEEV